MDEPSNGDIETERLRPEVEVSEKWLTEQKALRAQIIETDCETWQTEKLVKCNDAEDASNTGFLDDGSDLAERLTTLNLSTSGNTTQSLEYVAGVDLSYLKNETTACAALVVCKMPNLEVVYEDFQLHEVTVPYIAGYLSFRETPPLVEAFQRLKDTKPEYIPQAILVDGNGLLHYREAGIACHLGVKVNVPTVGVAKNLLAVGQLEKNEEHKEKIAGLQKTGDSFPLCTQTGKVLGVALKTCEDARNPVYVSIGHKISLETAIWLVLQCSKYRIPEPIRQADQRSRSFLRDRFPELFQSEKQQSSKKNSAATAL